jgi:HlyD family secretion protein
MIRRIAILIVLAAAAAAGFYFYRQSTRPKPPSNLLKVSGNIEAHESLVGFKVPGRIVALPVEEGQTVEPSTLLARLDDADYLQRVKIDEATVKVKQDELTLSLAGTRRQEIQSAHQAVLDAQADLRLKQVDYQRAESLFKEDALSAQSRDIAATDLARARARYESAKQAYDQAVEGTRKEQIAINRAGVGQAEQNLKLARIELGYTVLRAPESGVILVRQAELGEVVAPGTPVVTLADLDHVWLRAYVNETDLGRVRWGQAVKVTTDTYPGKIYRGRISFISSSAEFTPKAVQTQQERVTLVYRIKIDLENPHHELKPGMPADAMIELAKAEPKTQ